MCAKGIGGAGWASNGATVTIRKIFGEEKTNYNHLKLITNDGATKQKNDIIDLIAKNIILPSTLSNSPTSYPGILDYSENSSSSGEGILANLEDGYVYVGSENNKGTYELVNNIQGVLGTPNNDALHGDYKDNSLHGMAGDDLIHGKKGDDLLDGGTGNDTYLVSAGDGHDTIEDSGGDKDTIKFILGQLQLNQFFLEKDKNNLVVSYNNNQGSVTVSDYFLNNDNRIEHIQFDNGILYDVNKLTQTASSFPTTTGVDQWSYGFSTLLET